MTFVPASKMAVATDSSVPAGEVPVSSHVAGDFVQPFLQPGFDPATYFNNALPSALATPSSSSSSSSSSNTRTSSQINNSTTASVAELSSQLQSLLAQLNAHTTRLSTTLTQLTDDILRSGARLAYEVEVLGGDTRGLTDALEEGLQEEIAVLAPAVDALPNSPNERRDGDQGEAQLNPQGHAASPPIAPTQDTMLRLRTLTTVRSRLDDVIRTFDAAMQWPVASSEFQLAPSLVSVSGPAATGVDTTKLDERAKQYIDTVRAEVLALLSSGSEGVQAANERIQQLQTLAEVWKGTAEEKPRLRIIDSLQKLIEEKLKTVGGDSARHTSAASRLVDYRYGDTDTSRLTETGGGGGYGFLQNLRNLRSDTSTPDNAL